MDAGTDVSAIAWKILQQTQIQNQLDQTHYIHEKGNTEENIERVNNDISKNPYLFKINEIFEKSQNNLEKILFTKLFLEETVPEKDLIKTKLFKIDTEQIFTSLSHFIDIRKSKFWVEYMLSDKKKRYGTTASHPVYPAIPGWIIDAVYALKKNPNLYLIYSTDVRGVDKWLGHLCSIINISKLLYLRIEKEMTNLNATLIFLHVAGLLTPETLNPINRQGMKYPCSILQKVTFENVRLQLLSASHENKLCDNLCNFVGATTTCVPQRTGTNCFNLLMKK